MTDKKKLSTEKQIAIYDMLDAKCTVTDEGVQGFMTWEQIRGVYNSIIEETKEIDFKKELRKHFGQVKDFTLCMNIAKKFYDKGYFDGHIHDGDKIVHVDSRRVNVSRLQRVAKPIEEPVSNPTPNEKMSVERWKMACEAACCDRNYRSHYGLTETRDDYFVDGVQWADEHPKEEPVSEDLEEAANNAVISLIPSFGQKNSDGSYVSSYRDCFKREEFINLFMAGANWKEHQMIAKTIDGKVIANGMGKPILHLWDKGKHLIDKKVKVIIIKEG